MEGIIESENQRVERKPPDKQNLVEQTKDVNITSPTSSFLSVLGLFGRTVNNDKRKIGMQTREKMETVKR